MSRSVWHRKDLASAGLLLLCFLLSACGKKDGIMEMELVSAMPSGDNSAFRFLQVQARRAVEFPFNQPWVGEDPVFDLRPDPVDPGVSEQMNVSVVSEVSPIDMNVKIRYCTQDNCSSLEEGAEVRELWFTFESAIYIGEYTFWRPEADVLRIEATENPGPTVFPKCSTEGCITGDISDNFCREDGTHFCE